ncbi:MAG: hypothetical protein EHM49_08670 [Deltaproteobacteria bacterium]|nr:MAG: hypothetical protein EHM49_08670 [Deltaproteobacteria bacterium]
MWYKWSMDNKGTHSGGVKKSGFKYHEKADRNRRLFEYWKSHEGMTMRAIAGIFHISKTRAHAIIKKRLQSPSAAPELDSSGIGGES